MVLSKNAVLLFFTLSHADSAGISQRGIGSPANPARMCLLPISKTTKLLTVRDGAGAARAVVPGLNADIGDNDEASRVDNECFELFDNRE